MYYDKLSDLGIKLTRRVGSEQTQCPKCHDGRKNKNRRSLSVNITTGEYCCHNHPCDFKGNVRAEERKEKKIFKKPDQKLLKKIEVDDRAITYLSKRGLSKKTLEKFMVFTKREWMPQTKKEENCICFPYIRNAELVNVKFRDGAKNFKLVSEAELIFFGMHLIGNRKHFIITEGEVDSMTCFEVGYGNEQPKINVDENTGELIPTDDYSLNKWASLSVPSGASQARAGETPKLEYLDNCFEDLIGVEEFIIATDGDDAGIVLREELIRRLGIERCRYVEYPKDQVVPLESGLKRRCKDLNEVLLYLGEEAVRSCIENAKFKPIDGVYYLQDMYPRMLEKFRKGLKVGDTTRMGLHFDEKFRWKKGDLNLGVGYGNWGKTYFQNQLELTKSIYDDWKWGVFCPENFPADDFYDDLIEPFIGKPLSRMTEQEYEFGCRFIQEHFFYVYPDDNHDLQSIHERFRHLIMKKGLDGVRIDPYNQLDKATHQYGMTVEERISIDLKAAKRFALLNGIAYTILAHPKNPTYNADKSLPVVDMYDISGGAQWGNKCDNIWSLYRPNWHINKSDPTVEIHIQKIKRKRTGGDLGVVTFMLNNDTKRFINESDQQPCDPERARIILGHEASNYSQIPLGMSLENIDEEDLPF